MFIISCDLQESALEFVYTLSSLSGSVFVRHNSHGTPGLVSLILFVISVFS